MNSIFYFSTWIAFLPKIYALNEVMTENERNKFLQFMNEKHKGATKISLNV
jgi:hypothetical protein